MRQDPFRVSGKGLEELGRTSSVSRRTDAVFYALKAYAYLLLSSV